MSNFTQVLADDMDNVFLTDFAETVTYTKRAGGTRSILAIIDRDPPEDDMGTTRPKLMAIVANNATTGILSSELDSGDTMTVAYRKSATAVAYKLKRYSGPETEDTAMLRLELH